MAKKAKYLVIVESPSKAKTINKILKDDYLVIASYGHVRDLPKSKIGIDLKTFEITNIDSPDKKDKINDIKTAAKGKEKIFLCSDPDREGEFISLSLAEVLSEHDVEMVRATFNEITPKAVLEAINNPREINMALVDAQQARRALDRIVGYKLSPLLWTKIKRGLSAGRVQSVAVRLIVEREREIAAFKADEYWSVDAEFVSSGSFQAQLKTLDGKRVVSSAEDVEKYKAGESLMLLGADTPKIAEELTKLKYKVSAYDTSETSSKAYPPFTTSSLQITAANRLGFDAKRTMQIAQALYEGINGQHGLITYMRTDSLNVSKDAQAAVRTFIVSSYGQQYCPTKPNFYKSKAGAQEAHECIRPTCVTDTPENVRSQLQPDQYRLYKLIWERFTASQMVPAIYDSTTCDISSETGRKATFRANGRVMKFAGWTAAYSSDEDSSVQLPDMKIGSSASVKKIEPKKHETQPPPRYNEATIVKVMEKEGIGRPSTYASIIQTIQDRKYVEKIGRGGKAPFKATDLGMVVTDSLVSGFPNIMSVSFTRDMEQHLDDIEDGKKTYKKVMEDFYSDFSKELEQAGTKMPSSKGGQKTNTPCPKCNKPMLKLLGSLGFFLKCEDEKCKHSQDLDGKKRLEPKATGLKCDLCGADVVLASGRFGEYLACQKYKEKGCTFTMKINKKGLPQRKTTPIKTDLKCDKCNKNDLVIRVASRKKTPAPFLSCSGFPKCRHAKELPESLKEKGEEALAAWRHNIMLDTRDAKTMSENMKDEPEK